MSMYQAVFVVVLYFHVPAQTDDTCHPVVSDKFLCLESNLSMDVIWTCDDVTDCSDPPDEDPDFCNNITCPADYIRCPGGQCIREVKLCDLIVDCKSGYDEDPTICPDPCLSMPCENGGTCVQIKYTNYTCICPDNFVGYNCSELVVEETGLDPLTLGVIAAVGGVTAANTGCMIYNWYKDVKNKADTIQSNAKKIKKNAKTIKKVTAKKPEKKEKKKPEAKYSVVSEGYNKQKQIAANSAKISSKINTQDIANRIISS